MHFICSRQVSREENPPDIKVYINKVLLQFFHVDTYSTPTI